MRDVAPLPTGFTVGLGEDTVVCGRGSTLLGGSTGTLLRLRPRARTLLVGGRVVVADRDSALLARLLLDRGLADPVWPRPSTGPAADARAAREVTAVVPVKDRAFQLARLLRSLPDGMRVLVVDDGSRDPGPVASVAAHAGAEVLRHERNRGPAAARNTGLAAVRTPFVAFLDSDVVPTPGWLSALHRHFADAGVGAVGPRVRGLGEAPVGVGGSWLERYEAARSSLDLGPAPAAVRPHGRVSYLPSATLMVRCAAMPGGFEEGMRVAEDVDAVWRMCASGWRVRYEPAAVVRHDHRTTPTAWWGRRMFYGTGAALLAERHGSAVAPMVLSPWTAALSAVVLAQRRWSLPAATGVLAVATATTAYRLRTTETPVRTAARVIVIGSVATAHQTASALTRHYWPVALPAALFSSRARRALLTAAVVQGLLDHRRTRPRLDPVRYVLALRLDDLAYGAGLWTGAFRRRSVRALVPRWRTQPGAPGGRPVAPTLLDEHRPPTNQEGSTHGQERLVRNGR